MLIHKSIKTEILALLRADDLMQAKREHIAILHLEQRGMLRCWQQAQSNAEQRLQDFVRNDTWKTTFEHR